MQTIPPHSRPFLLSVVPSNVLSFCPTSRPSKKQEGPGKERERSLNEELSMLKQSSNIIERGTNQQHLAGLNEEEEKEEWWVGRSTRTLTLTDDRACESGRQRTVLGRVLLCVSRGDETWKGREDTKRCMVVNYGILCSRAPSHFPVVSSLIPPFLCTLQSLRGLYVVSASLESLPGFPTLPGAAFVWPERH